MDEADATVRPGDVVQVDPEALVQEWRGCFALVLSVHDRGVVGVVALPEAGGVPANRVLRLPWGEVRRVGRAAWVPLGD